VGKRRYLAFGHETNLSVDVNRKKNGGAMLAAIAIVGLFFMTKKYIFLDYHRG